MACKLLPDNYVGTSTDGPRYILLTIAVASLSMGLVASVQKSTLQGGLVTAIPTCTSFAAYSVAYFFPTRYIGDSDEWGAMV
jgi:hypothetical protein